MSDQDEQKMQEHMNPLDYVYQYVDVLQVKIAELEAQLMAEKLTYKPDTTVEQMKDVLAENMRENLEVIEALESKLAEAGASHDIQNDTISDMNQLLSKYHEQLAEAEQYRDKAIKDRIRLERINAELEAAQSAEGWQPIETAPKDGTTILLYDIDHLVRIGAWMVGLNFIGWNYSENPTDWQSLPPPPAAKDGT